MTTIDWTNINRDTNGNTRYVCHFLHLLTDEEKRLTNRYAIACKRANTIGGRKFHNKQYGGGIVFQAMECELSDLEQRINQLVGEANEQNR